jgi:hypothetical protein
MWCKERVRVHRALQLLVNHHTKSETFNLHPKPARTSSQQGFYRLSRDPVFNPCAFARIARYQLTAWNNLYNSATDMKVTCTMNGKWMLWWMVQALLAQRPEAGDLRSVWSTRKEHETQYWGSRWINSSRMPREEIILQNFSSSGWVICNVQRQNNTQL